MQDEPEISDLVVDYASDTLARRSVRKSEVLNALKTHDNRWAQRIVQRFPATDDLLDPSFIDGVLVRSHLELQRLHEEFLMGLRMLEVLGPLVRALQQVHPSRPIRIVDIGCGLGFVIRWLASQEISSWLGTVPTAPVQFVGADYNQCFTRAARTLAAQEQLPCTFVTGNAFQLKEPATIYTSTGVLHHFRGNALREVFAQQDQAGALACVHFDIKPSVFAPIGSWIFHQARMREPLAQHDGYLSAARAHSEETLCTALREGAPGFRFGVFDGNVGILRLVRIMHAVIAVRPSLEEPFRKAMSTNARRLSSMQGAP